MDPTLPKRLISLDAFRGFTIAAMVVVNDPGSWQYIYPPLHHAEWNGCTPTDLIFPFFLFIVGVSITLAFSKRLQSGQSKVELYKKVLFRTVKIYLLGLFLWLWPDFNFHEIRWAGVLQRIALVYCICAFLYLNLDWKRLAITTIGILVLYWIMMAYIPVPGTGTPDLSVPGLNWANWLDRAILPGVMWQGTWDPEGILSTFPAIATGIIGMLTGIVLKSKNETNQKLVWLFFSGFLMFVVGLIFDWAFPLNKNIWSSSYVLYTGGLAVLSLAAFILIVDVWGILKWTYLGRVYGANAIVSYVLAGMLTLVFYDPVFSGQALSHLFMEAITGLGTPSELASLLYALIYMHIIFIPAYILYRFRIFIKV